MRAVHYASRAAILALTAAILAPAAASAQASTQCFTPLHDQGTAFVDVTVVPMDRERLLQKRTVLVRGCRIQVVGHRDSVDIPQGYHRVQGGDDAFLMPGLVDAHVHLRYDHDLDLYGAMGVTTVRNMEGNGEHLAWRRAVAEGAFGPRIITAGPTDYADAASAAELERQVAAMAAEGYDFVKVFDPLPAASYGWLIDAAAKAGLPIAGHIPAAVGARTVLAERSHQTIEHAEQFVYHWFGDDLDVSRIPELAAQVKASGAAVTPTLEVVHSWVDVVEDKECLLTRPEIRWLHPETLAYWNTFQRTSSFENRLIADLQADILVELARQGVPILAGTDMYLVGLVGPWALRREMRRMEAAGLTPYQVLQAATATPAAVLGYNAGTVAAGRQADLLLVHGNPLKDLAVLDRVDGVMLDGRWHPAEEMAERLAAVAAEYAPGNAFVTAALAGRVDEAVAAHRNQRAAGNEDRLATGTVSYVASIVRQWGRNEDAVALYELVLEEDPQRASAHEGIARAYLAMGRVGDAKAALLRALDVEPERASARQLLEEIGGPVARR
jgi:tetratricopeptide (TPR) repeat protein